MAGKYPIVTKCSEKMVFFKIVTKSQFVAKLGVTKMRLHRTFYIKKDNCFPKNQKDHLNS